MNRRNFLIAGGAALTTLGVTGGYALYAQGGPRAPFGPISADFEGSPWRDLTEEEWRARLTPEQFRVLRKEGTERAFTSPLDTEKRTGIFACAGCGLPLFSSETKFDSGTGWPSFYDVIPGRVNTKADYRLWTPRTEYHCARCGGHQGHVFEDGPAPTGLRYCNNGVALVFVPNGDPNRDAELS